MIQLKKHLLEQIQNQKLPLVNSKLSQSLGRRLYRMQLEGENVWLKLHANGFNTESEISFLHELNQYQRLSTLVPEILLPFQIAHFSKWEMRTESLTNQALLVVEAEGLFDIDPNQLTYSEILDILNLSLDVVDHLHEIAYIHGDLKIEHFRKYKGRAVLIDFEQAHFILESQMMKNSATPRYMAPELFHGRQKNIQTDIYALGIVWLEWFTQEKIVKKTYLDWAKWHCQELNVCLLDKFKCFEEILNWMLAKNNVNRCVNIYQIKQILSQNVQRKSRDI